MCMFPIKGGCGLARMVPDRDMKMLRGLEQLSCGARLGELGVSSLEKRRLQRDTRAPSST